jgi:RHS repeat-associated protein
MKKIILIQSLLLVIFSYAQNSGFTTTKNYIYSKDCLNEDCTKTTESVQYFDQLGRVEQVVGIKASPGGKDIVSHVPYDRFGRQVDGWLPVALNSQNGGIHDSAAVKSQAISFYGDSRPFTHKTLDNSPLDITTVVYRQGEAWQNHPAGMQYDANAAGEVKKYVATFVWSEGRTVNTLIPNATYAENSLSKVTQTDEDGNVSIEFKNKKGEVVLSRKVAGASENADTYYVYNSLGQLAYVIPPLAAISNSIDQNTLDNLCYQYRYDGLGRLAEKKQPGKGWEYMVYDKANRLILTQDANMRSSGKWFISKYDTFGRVIYTGIIAGGSRESMQSQAGGSIITETRDNTGFAKSAMQVYYTNSFFSQIETVLSVNYYDTYPTDAPAIPSQIIGQNVLTQDAQNAVVSTKALPVASYVKNVEEDTWTKTFTWYDTRGRVIGSHSVNYLGGYTKTENELDFAGVVQQTKAYHKRLNTDSEKVITQRFDYDAQNRLKRQWHNVNGLSDELLAENIYNELSQLTNKKVGNGLQSIDYTYDIRGTVTKMNDPANLGLHLFGYELRSFNPQNTVSSTGKYNGNITEADWKTSTDNVLRRYNYQYDALNRLKKGVFSEPNASVPQNDFYNETVAYDLNGNIQTLQRSGNNYTGSAQLIDNLSYAYTGNRLQTVTDNSGNYAGYPDVSGNPITYDDNGNMKDQKDKGILQINYNFLNLPDYMKFDKTYVPRFPFLGDYNVNTKYLYRADGTKLKKVYTYGSGKANSEVSTTTEYLDGFQYEYVDTGALLMAVDLKFVPTSEGYYNFENNKYIYNYTDHLGNVRLSYFRNGTNGSAEVLEENNYYPFGLKQQNFISVGGSAYKYQYNGKELQGETGWNDYGARMYMPEIGRWNGMDPLSEMYYEYSPYNYALNNPIKYIDPNGMWIDIIDGDKTYRYNKGKLYMQNKENNKWDIEVSVTSDSYAGQILAALTSITGGDPNSFGSLFLGFFANDNMNTTIQSGKGTKLEGQNGTSLDGSQIFTAFNQKVDVYTSMSGEKSNKTQNPFFVTLFHELGHSWMDQKFSRLEMDKVWVDGRDDNIKDLNQSEIVASYIENLLRSEQGLPIRISYSPDSPFASILVDAASIKWQPSIKTDGSENSKINLNTRIFTMPMSVQVIFNTILNTKK